MTFCWICDKDRETNPKYCPDCKLKIKKDKKSNKPFKIGYKRFVKSYINKIERGNGNVIEVGVSYKHKTSNTTRFVDTITKDGDIYWEDQFGKGLCSYKHFAFICDITKVLY